MADLEMQLISLLSAMVDRQGGPLELRKRLAALQDPRISEWGYNFRIEDIHLVRDPVTHETGPGVAVHRMRINLVTNYDRTAIEQAAPPAVLPPPRRLLGWGRP